MRNSNRKIKVTHVVTSLDVGGMENGIVNLCNRHDRDRFDLTICCLKSKGAMIKRLRNDIEVVCMNFPEGKPTLLPIKMARYFRESKPNIVHTHGLAGGSYIGIVGAKLARVPVIINGEHGSFFLKAHQVFLQRILAAMCDVTLSVSESLKDKIVEYLAIPPKQIQVVRNGVDTSKFTGEHDYSYIIEECSNKHGISLSKDNFIVGSIGSLKPEKNQVMLLKAFYKIKHEDRDKNIKVIFVGEGPDFHKLAQFVKNNGFERDVVFLGNREDVPQLLSLFDVLISTSISRHEGMSNVILEAMSSGLPVIATRFVGTSETVLEGETGFLVEENDIPALVNRINLLRDNLELTRKMGARAQEIVRRDYSITKMVENYEKLYLDIFYGKKK